MKMKLRLKIYQNNDLFFQEKNELALLIFPLRINKMYNKKLRTTLHQNCTLLYAKNNHEILAHII